MLKRSARRLAVTLVLALSMAASATACTGEIPLRIDRGEDILVDAIDTLGNAPGNWQAVLEPTIEQLRASGSELLGEVETLYNQALGKGGAEIRCNADFIGDRLGAQLQNVLHRVAPAKYVQAEYKPVICQTDPTDRVVVGETSQITFWGYDFETFAREGAFSVDLLRGDGSVVTSDVGHLAVTTPYQMSLQFRGELFTTVTANDTPRLRLTWNEGLVGAEGALATSEIPVQVPLPPPPPPPKERKPLSFLVEAYAPPGFKQNCISFIRDLPVGAGWVIDTSVPGSTGTPGVDGPDESGSNQQGIETRRYHVVLVGGSTVKVSGRVCGAGRYGPGGVYKGVFLVHTVAI